MTIDSDEHVIISDTLRPILPDHYTGAVAKDRPILVSLVFSDGVIEGRFRSLEYSSKYTKVSVGLDSESAKKALASIDSVWSTLILQVGDLKKEFIVSDPTITVNVGVPTTMLTIEFTGPEQGLL